MDAREATAPLLAAAAERLGRPLHGGERGGASDASHVSQYVPVTIDGLGPRGGGAHPGRIRARRVAAQPGGGGAGGGRSGGRGLIRSASSRAATATAAPAITSSHQWWAVTTMSTPTKAGYSAHGTRPQRDRSRHSGAHEATTAKTTWPLGNAASASTAPSSVRMLRPRERGERGQEARRRRRQQHVAHDREQHREREDHPEPRERARPRRVDPEQRARHHRHVEPDVAAAADRPDPAALRAGARELELVRDPQRALQLDDVAGVRQPGRQVVRAEDARQQLRGEQEQPQPAELREQVRYGAPRQRRASGCGDGAHPRRLPAEQGPLRPERAPIRSARATRARAGAAARAARPGRRPPGRPRSRPS